MIKSGIYQILNIITKMMYIGSGIFIERRFVEHRKTLRKNKHPNRHLQAAWNKYWEPNFRFEVLEYVEDLSKLTEREQHWLDQTRCCDRTIGYNLRPRAESNLGVKFSDEFRLKRARIQTGKYPSIETRAKMSLARINKKRSPEIGQKISASKKGKGVGRKLSEETLKNMSIAQLKRNKIRKAFFSNFAPPIIIAR